MKFGVDIFLNRAEIISNKDLKRLALLQFNKDLDQIPNNSAIELIFQQVIIENVVSIGFINGFRFIQCIYRIILDHFEIFRIPKSLVKFGKVFFEESSFELFIAAIFGDFSHKVINLL